MCLTDSSRRHRGLVPSPLVGDSLIITAIDKKVISKRLLFSSPTHGSQPAAAAATAIHLHDAYAFTHAHSCCTTISPVDHATIASCPFRRGRCSPPSLLCNALACVPVNMEPPTSFMASTPSPPPVDATAPSYDPQHPATVRVSSDTGRPASALPPHHIQGSISSSRAPSVHGRNRGFSTASSASSIVKRKPLPPTASPLVTRFSDQSLVSALYSPPLNGIDTFTPQPLTIDGQSLYGFPRPPSTVPSDRAPLPDVVDPSTIKRSSNESATLTSPTSAAAPPARDAVSHLSLEPPATRDEWPESTSPTQKDARLTTDTALSAASDSTGPWYHENTPSGRTGSVTMSLFSNKPPPPTLTLPTAQLPTPLDSSPVVDKPLPKSPADSSKLRSFFGWGGNTSPVSTSTSFSDKGYSPIPLPLTPNHAYSPERSIKPAVEQRASGNADSYYGYAHIPSPTDTTPGQVEEMEEELRLITTELATSIRRELDLEDLVERLQAEAANPPGRRTSDYFSDSGTSSVKAGDGDARVDELERLQRRTEQEKAQIRLELSSKLQDERKRRKQLDVRIQELEYRASQVDTDKIGSEDTSGRLRELESTCEDLRRRLAEEREMKNNFEDLFTALKSELQSSSNERDNLKDEIVPQLRARVEGLEAQAAEHEQLAYETTKMQQEIQALRIENQNLLNAQKVVGNRARIDSIVEEMPISEGPGLSRSSSLARRSIKPKRSSSLTRSNSVKGLESRETLAERVKDVEMQRDALHKALKSLLDRQEHQAREYAKKIRHLEMERDRALSASPRRPGFSADVDNLRYEVNNLRRRADEAIEQKWQCEKGLSGLKMDLDRAEQEISSLRNLLHANDITVPGEDGLGIRGAVGSTVSLEQSYEDLKKSYADALEHIQSLESTSTDTETQAAIKQLEKSLSDAIAERDFATQEAETFRLQADALKESEKRHLDEESKLADDLRGSAKRVEELATQVRQQLATNATLRQRLSDAIERGEKEQQANAHRITYMQEKLKSLEDQLMAAQQVSEDLVTKHEEDLKDVKETHNTQLQRVKDGLRSPRLFAPKSPLSPLLASANTRSPRLDVTSSGPAQSLAQQTQVEELKARVIELERALADADAEMEEVVGKMNIAQIEVMELQNEREEAVRLTKRLQAEIANEQLRNFQARFNTMLS